jgi:hypothetical protein
MLLTVAMAVAFNHATPLIGHTLVSLCYTGDRRASFESVNSEDGLPGARFSNFFEIDNLKFQKNMKKNLGCR